MLPKAGKACEGKISIATGIFVILRESENITGIDPKDFMTEKIKKQKIFWEVFYKRDTREFEIRGPSTDDTDFTNKVWEMQQAGYSINCSTPPYEYPRENMIRDMEQQGYKHVDGLFWDTYLKCKKPESGKRGEKQQRQS